MPNEPARPGSEEGSEIARDAGDNTRGYWYYWEERESQAV